MGKAKYIIVKQSPCGKIYVLHKYSDDELSEHIAACFRFTQESILSVTKVNQGDNNE